ncbi:hypothetical protein [Emticicia sp. SJ17W-69]|uniref:hypothetical protein n=1 Tax=Emticicia sp. SJ17W-69 TaxID=3421657 RepID=UPI003EB7F5CF
MKIKFLVFLLLSDFCLYSQDTTFIEVKGKTNRYFVKTLASTKFIWNINNNLYKEKQKYFIGNINEIPSSLPNYLINKEKIVKIGNEVLSENRVKEMSKINDNIFINFYFLPRGKIIEIKFMLSLKSIVKIEELEELEKRLKNELSFIPDVKCFDDEKYKDANYVTYTVRLNSLMLLDHRSRK